MYFAHTIAPSLGAGWKRGGRAELASLEGRAPQGATAPRVSVPVRGSSVITGLNRSCRAELVGFAAPIGRVSAVLRILDEAAGTTATSVVPVELRVPVERRTGTGELVIPHSEVRARDLRAETEPVRLVLRLAEGTLLEDFLTAHLDRPSAHRLALGLTTALHAGVLTV